MINNEALAGTFGAMTDNPVGNGYIGKFDNPILLPSSAYYPATLTAAFDYCFYYYHRIPNFRQVQKRLVRYFITDFEFPGDGDEREKEKLRKYLKNILDIEAKMLEMGDDWGCYGNAFMRFHYPFTRVLVDKRGGAIKLYYLSQFPEESIKFDLKSLTYEVPDPRTNGRSRVRLDFEDFEERTKDRMKLIRIDPRDIRIVYNELTDSASYVYKFAPRVRSQIQNNVLLTINTTPKYMLEAISKNCDLAFNEGEIFHFRAPTVSGVSYSCWGLPELMANMGMIYQIFAYMKADEAIARDMITPFRIFSMTPGGGEDPLHMMDGLFFQQQTSEIIANRRKDPLAIHSLPFPVNYQEFGANGKQYTPKDLLEYQNNQLLNSSGFPVDLYTCTMQVNQLPTALRLFQNNFWFIYNLYNKFLKWVVKKVQDYAREAPIEIQLQEPRFIDDLENTNLLGQLVMGDILPYDAIFKKLGIGDAVSAILRRQRQDAQIETGKTKIKEEVEKKEQAEAILQSNLETNDGNATAPAGAMGMPITDLYTQATALAQQWLSMPVGQRRQEMIRTREENNNLYLLAQQIMDQQRDQLRSQGEQMLKEQNGYF